MAEITYGRWSPNEVANRVLDGVWPTVETVGALQTISPSSLTYSGTTASISGSGTVDFTSCSSLTLNGVFSSTYRHYLIYLTATADAANSVRISFPNDNGTTSVQALNVNSAATTTAIRTTTLYVTSQSLTTGYTAIPTVCSIFLSNPNNAMVTTGFSEMLSTRNKTDAVETFFRTSSTMAFTDVTFSLTSSGFFTGSVMVYGFQK